MARRGHDLIILSLPGEKLEEVAVRFETNFGIEAIPYELDFTDREQIFDFHKWVLDNGFAINTLINNAGFGLHGPFEKSDLKSNYVMMSVNMIALHTLTQLLLPILQLQKDSYILNMGSAAGFMDAVPFKATYSASKAFVKNFSLGLNRELRGTGTRVSCVCPGAVISNEKVEARIEAAGYWARKSAFTTQQISRISIDGMLKGKKLIIPGKVNKMVYFLNWLLPLPIAIRITENTFKRQSKNGFV